MRDGLTREDEFKILIQLVKNSGLNEHVRQVIPVLPSIHEHILFKCQTQIQSLHTNKYASKYNKQATTN